MLVGGVAAICCYAYMSWFGPDVVARHGGSVWVAVKPNDPRLSASMRVALRDPVPLAQPGPFQWASRADGLETTELPVIAEGNEVDRLLLVRIDPAKYRFETRNAPAGDRDLAAWMNQLHAVVVTNGSYFGPNGTPATPFLSDRTQLGPWNYHATHGAFLASDQFTGVQDLQQQDWRVLFRQARFGMVSYPLLLGPSPSRIQADHRWLANRTFIGNGFIRADHPRHHQGGVFLAGSVSRFLEHGPLGFDAGAQSRWRVSGLSGRSDCKLCTRVLR